MSQYNVIAETPETTIAANYEPTKDRSDSYQSEAELEARFIQDLMDQGYLRLTIHSEEELIANLRRQLETLNKFTFSDDEWTRFFHDSIANVNDGILEKTRKIQQDHVQVLKRDDGTTKNVYLIDKKNIHNNIVQVLNQFEEKGGKHNTRYDVTVLVNGLPLVHIELKRRGVAIREAFNQIDRYQRDSFWAGSGLYEYVQIFVISNGTFTKYYSNTTRDRHIKQQTQRARGSGKKTSNTFEFTSYWADSHNQIISDLRDFTRTFFAKHALLNILTKFCVLTEEEALLVMRPYQICATEQILMQIQIAYNNKKYGTVDAGGYIWHTTGSGKTLTSFKTAQLASRLPYIDKVFFVVDRKDLDYQTMREYDRFEKGAADGNTSTRVLQRQIEDPNSRIIITTIQKLSTFVKKNPNHPAFKQHIVMIFDECHRSQFGDMHQMITKCFKAYYLFGFTGTPIFAANAQMNGNPLLRTTEQAFGRKLHSYTIINAINDGNVLPFRIDYIETIKRRDDIEDKKVQAIDSEAILLSPKRIEKVVSYILEHYDQKTKRNEVFTVKGKRVIGFNSIMATASVPAAMAYYNEFKRQLGPNPRLRVATIFSFAANEEDPEKQNGIITDETLDTENLDQTARDFLDSAIGDYNQMFNTNFDTSGDKFQNYYKDLSMRMKNREVDLTIVVNMFLTGFDATTLNTLWVDKNLKMHGLIQAYSRTNRILNSVKTYGNIVCFRKLDNATDEALALFGNEKASGMVVLRPFEDYLNGYTDNNGKTVKGYLELVEELKERFPLGEPIVGEDNKKDFIRLFGDILRLRNILTAFDDFKVKDTLSERDRQDYQSHYLDIYDELRPTTTQKENVTDDLIFELELVRQDQINIDYILRLVEEYKDKLCKDKDVLARINKALNSNPELRSKKELIDQFIAKVNPGTTSVVDAWRKHVDTQMEEELRNLISEEKLKPEATRKLVMDAFRDGELPTTGMALDSVLPPMGLFNNQRPKKLAAVIERLKAFFEKFAGLIGLNNP